MSRNVVTWDVPINARWARSCELRGLWKQGGLRIELQEYLDDIQSYGRTWLLTFHPLQAFRWITEELHLQLIPEANKLDGAFFIVEDSDWIADLKQSRVGFLDRSHHYVVMCYDDVIDVVAWDCVITEVPDVR